MPKPLWYLLDDFIVGIRKEFQVSPFHITFQYNIECGWIIEFKTTDTDIITIDHFWGCTMFHLGPLRHGDYKFLLKNPKYEPYGCSYLLLKWTVLKCWTWDSKCCWKKALIVCNVVEKSKLCLKGFAWLHHVWRCVNIVMPLEAKSLIKGLREELHFGCEELIRPYCETWRKLHDWNCGIASRRKTCREMTR